jgi:hypothetical protein
MRGRDEHGVAEGYRAQAARLREEAENAVSEPIRRELVNLALRFDGLAATADALDERFGGRRK